MDALTGPAIIRLHPDDGVAIARGNAAFSCRLCYIFQC